MRNRYQFNLASVLTLIGIVAAALALAVQLGPIVILTSLLPLVLIAEFLLGKPGVSDARVATAQLSYRVAVLLSGGIASSAIAWVSTTSTGTPTVLAPIPLLTAALPFFVDGPWALRLITPCAFFLVLNLTLVSHHRSALPLRFPILLSIATICSIFWLIGGYAFGLTYQGADYTLAITVLNVLLIAGLWLLWLKWRNTDIFFQQIGYGLALNAWLFWFAFPWFGELP